MKNFLRIQQKYQFRGPMENLEMEIQSFEKYRWKKFFIDSDKKGDFKYRVSAMISVGTLCGMGLCSGISSLLRLKKSEKNIQEIELQTKFRWEWILFVIGYIIFFILLDESANEEIYVRLKELFFGTIGMIIAYRFQDYLLVRKIEKLLRLEKTN